MSANFNIIGTSDYRKNFWNAMRQEPYNCMVLKHAEGKPVSAYTLHGQVGYLAMEFVDGRLMRREAVKALKITA